MDTLCKLEILMKIQSKGDPYIEFFYEGDSRLNLGSDGKWIGVYTLGSNGIPSDWCGASREESPEDGGDVFHRVKAGSLTEMINLLYEKISECWKLSSTPGID